MSGPNQNLSLNQSFLDFWSLSRAVFSSPGWETGLFVPQSKETMLQRLKLYSDRRGALIVLTAPHGHGKTTIARWIYDTLSLQQHEAVFLTLFKPEPAAGWLLPRLCEFFGVASSSYQAAPSDIVQDIAGHIEEIKEEGRQLTLIIDEADKIQTIDAFAEIHALTSIHTGIDTCINIMLIGNSELARRIENSPPLMSRLVFQAHFDPLTPEETDAYIDYRLDAAHLDRRIMTSEARQAIANLGGGVFSMINTLGDNSLVEAYLGQKRTIDGEIVEKAASFLSLAAQKGRKFAAQQNSESVVRRAGKETSALASGGGARSVEKTGSDGKENQFKVHEGGAVDAKESPSAEVRNNAAEKKNVTLTSLFYKDKDKGS